MWNKETGLYLIIVIVLLFSLYWYIRARRLENKVLGVENLTGLANTWDKDYRSLINMYGTVANFVEAHMQDFDIIRSNILVYLENMERFGLALNMYTSVLNGALDDIYETTTDKETKKKVKALKVQFKSLNEDTSEYLNGYIGEMYDFLRSEVEVHKVDCDIDKVLVEVKKSEYIKDVNFFDE